MSSPSSKPEYHRLNELLWRYRPCVDRFEFLLEMQYLIAASGRNDHLHHVADLLMETADLIADLDLEREVVVGAGASLAELAAEAPEPWSDILDEQLNHLRDALARTGQLKERNEKMIAVNAAGIDRLLANIAELGGNGDARSQSYDGDGHVRRDYGSTLLFDGRA